MSPSNYDLSSVDFDGGTAVYSVNNCVFIDSTINPQTKNLVAMNVSAYTDGTDRYCELDDLHAKGMLLERVAADAVRAIVGDPEGSTTHAMFEMLDSVFKGSTRNNVQIHNGGHAERQIGGHTVTFQLADIGIQFSIPPSGAEPRLRPISPGEIRTPYDEMNRGNTIDADARRRLWF
jgi:hypothetical protein